MEIEEAHVLLVIVDNAGVPRITALPFATREAARAASEFLVTNFPDNVTTLIIDDREETVE